MRVVTSCSYSCLSARDSLTLDRYEVTLLALRHSDRPRLPASSKSHIPAGHEFNVRLVNGGKILDREPNYYIDFCHFDSRGHEVIARLLKESLSDVLGP